MTLSGIESISSLIQRPGCFVKCILGDSAAVFFPGTLQHRDIKRLGLSYEDDYRGNALAATVTPGRVDIRFHPEYSDERVRLICRRLKTSADLEWMRAFAISYQGRTVSA